MIKPSINDRINAILDDPIDVALNGRPYVEALQGVLRLHRSRDVLGYYGDRRQCCTACHSNGAIPVWPCATVQAIAAAFGVDGER